MCGPWFSWLIHNTSIKEHPIPNVCNQLKLNNKILMINTNLTLQYRPILKKIYTFHIPAEVSALSVLKMSIFEHYIFSLSLYTLWM